ncbi:MAG: ATP-binding cassette domain-containing protein [Candidatus Izemoplasmatales bacterium]|nr:ATP-binding cassette domain-containing protein [Candidatus Izemoplasmatales bacterium]
MVPIINQIYAKFLEKRINSAKTKIEFYDNFLPIKLQTLEDRYNRKVEIIKLKYKQKLLSLEIPAGVDSEYLKEIYETEQANLKDKFYWKERIVKASSQRKGENGKEQIQELEKEKSIKANAIKNKYYPKSTSEAIKNYETNQPILNETLEAKITKIQTSYQIKVDKFSNKSNKAVKRYQEININLSAKLHEITKDKIAKYSLEENVVLSLKSLSMHFGGLKAVDDLSFDVKEGEIFGLIGPNGAGKTTVFNCITRFYKPTLGDIYFKNIYDDVVYLNDKLVHNIIKEGIVRTFQNVEMVWELNVIDNLLVAAHTIYRSGFFGHLFNSRLLRQEEKVMRRKAMKILEDLGISAYQYAYPYGLPYGILKKIELARTLMANPKLIILDEPAAGLNDVETADLAKVIKKIRDEYNATIFLVEHDMGLVMDICDTVCAISFGKKLAMGSPKEIQNSKVVQEAYLGGE